jgi:hypothetical protein
MSAMSLRLPESLHEAARELARREGISVNQLVTTALAEKLTALMTVDYMERAKRGSREKFLAAMAHVPDVEPEAHDRLPAELNPTRASTPVKARRSSQRRKKAK